jgi:Holliday junction resolvase RusA-like endonuclease
VSIPDLQFEVFGDPRPQGSKRGFVAGGRVNVVDDNRPALRNWRTDVVAVCSDALTDAGWPAEPPREQPYGVHLTFRLRRPKSTRRVWPAVKPDVDKLARGVLDALRTAGCYRDDAQVVRLVADKEYAERPGVHVRVYTYEKGH